LTPTEVILRLDAPGERLMLVESPHGRSET